MIPSGLKTTNPLFLAFVSLYLYSSSASPINQTSHELPHPRRALEMTLGLNPFNLHRNGVAIGFLPALGESIDANLPSQINAKLGAPMAIMGDYISLETQDPHLKSIDDIGYVKTIRGNPVWQMALMPNEGLEAVTQVVANRIAAKMKSINDQGIVVWLRFAHEMNGDWYKWGKQPTLFIEKWRMVASAVKSTADKTYLLWAPNSAFADVDSLRGGYTPYWPGPEYVDIIGLSFYHYGGYNRNNVMPNEGEALGVIKKFSDMFGLPHNIPVVLAETGASYTRSIQTGQPAWGGASEHDIKYKWMQQILSPELRQAVPGFKAISWFEVNKHETASGNSPVKSEDFRLLMGAQELSRDSTAYFLHYS